MPGVQIPHCAPPCSRKDCWTASRAPAWATPSIVRIFAPSACSTGTRQLFTRSPFISMAQAPHSPSPQPSFVPVSFNSSRSASSRRAMGYASKVAGSPFTMQRTRSSAAFGGAAIQACANSRAASNSLRASGVTGMRRMSTPVACAMAFAMAGAVPSSGSSPMPFAPRGPGP